MLSVETISSQCAQLTQLEEQNERVDVDQVVQTNSDEEMDYLEEEPLSSPVYHTDTDYETETEIETESEDDTEIDDEKPHVIE